MIYLVAFGLGYLVCALVVMARVNRLKMQLKKVAENENLHEMYTFGVDYAISQIERWLGL